MSAALLGCGDTTSPAPTDLAAARQLWSTFGGESYEFTLSIGCECLPNGPMRVLVAGDSIVSANLVATGDSVPRAIVRTIPALFNFIEEAIAEDAYRIDVTYDPVRGYPREIIYDGDSRLADDEVYFGVDNVRLR